MNRVLCSTGGMVVRANNRNFGLLPDVLPQIRCDGVEFMLYEMCYPLIGELTRMLKEIPVEYPVLHAEKAIGALITKGDFTEARRRFEINCRLAEALGSEMLVLHLWDGIPSDSCMENNLSLCGELMSFAADHGLLMTVENVVCNKGDPWTHLLELLDRWPDIRFTFDTKMAHFHRQLEKLYEPDAAEVFAHISHLHINDHAGDYMDWSDLRSLHIGDGSIDFDRFFAFIRKKGYRGDFTVEANSVDAEGRVLPDKMNRTLDRIRAYIA